MSSLSQPLILSFQIAVTATILATLVGVPLAYFMSRRKFAGKSLVEAALILPLVLPPTVVGYFIIVTLGARGWLGRWLQQWFGYSILFRFEGAVLAAAIVAMPLLYMPAKAGFAAIEREFEDIARSFGATGWQVFYHVSLPLARRAIASGLLLAFARALGEFGATVMVFGWQENRLTLPISIYRDWEQGQLAAAAAAVVALTIVSLALVIAYERTYGKPLD